VIRQVIAANVPNGQEALKGRIYALRVVSFTPGDKIAFNDPGNTITIYAPGSTYRRRRGYEKIYLTSAVPANLVIEATEDVEEDLDPGTGLLVDPFTGAIVTATGSVQLPSLVAAGSTSGVAGSDLNSDDWQANNTRYSTWIDVRQYIAITLAANFESLAGVNGADTVIDNIEFSTDGHEVPGDVPLAATGAGGAGVFNGTPTATRTFVAAKFARVKMSKGAVAGPHRLRMQWWGQRT